MDVMNGYASMGQLIVANGRKLVTIPIAATLTIGVAGFWTLAAGLILVSGVIYHFGTMASQIIRRSHNG